MRWKKCDWCRGGERELVHVVYISNIKRPQRPAWSVWYLVAAPGLLGAATGSPKHTPQDPNFPLLPETGKHLNRMAGPYNSSKRRAVWSWCAVRVAREIVRQRV